MAPGEALGFGCVLAVGSVAVMGLAVNWAAAALLALTIAFYVFVYTIWLKRRTPQNIVIGGAAGALPPLVGWAAVDRRCRLGRRSRCSRIIFFWTPPHFWALSLYRAGEYAARRRADAAGGRRRRARPSGRCCSIRWCCGRLTLAPWLLGLAGSVYAVRRWPAQPALHRRARSACWRDAGRAQRAADVRLLAALSVPDLRAAAGGPRISGGRGDGSGSRLWTSGAPHAGAQPRAARGAAGAGRAVLRASPSCGWAGAEHGANGNARRTAPPRCCWRGRRRDGRAGRLPRCRSTACSARRPAMAARPSAPTAAPRTRVAEPLVTVRFNAETAPDLGWDFQPLSSEVTVHPGEQTHGRSSAPSTARAEPVTGRRPTTSRRPRPASISTSCSASASTSSIWRRAQSADMGVVVLRRSRHLITIPTPATSTRSPCPTPCSGPRTMRARRRPRPHRAARPN